MVGEAILEEETRRFVYKPAALLTGWP